MIFKQQCQFIILGVLFQYESICNSVYIQPVMQLLQCALQHTLAICSYSFQYSSLQQCHF